MKKYELMFSTGGHITIEASSEQDAWNMVAYQYGRPLTTIDVQEIK